MATATATNIPMKNLGGRVGSYAISTVDMDSWMNEPAAQAPQRSRKTKNSKEVLHKIFSDCALVIQDTFWIEKFNNAAMGKFPQKFNFHDGLLNYRKGAKCHSIEVSNNPYESSHACMEFFRTHGGIFSPADKHHSIELQYARAHAVLSQQQITWGDANKKDQEGMLSYYVTDMKTLMGLNDNEMEQLRETIRLGISNKFFGKHNIRVENNRIHSIEGLLWNNEQRNFYINPELKPNSTRTYTRKKDGAPSIDPSQKDTIPQFGIKWKKYVENLDKKIVRNNRRQRRIIVSQIGTNVRPLKLVTTSDYSIATTTTPRIDATDDDEYITDDDE